MSLLNNLSSAAKGASVTITLDKSALFALAPVAADPDFSVQASVVRAEVIFRSSVGGQKKRMFFDLTQSTPSAQLAFSNSAKDNFLLSKIILRSADDMIFAVTRVDLPSGLDIDMVSAPPPPASNTSLLMSMEGSQLMDNSSYANVFTMHGSVTLSTAQSKFGTQSLYFPDNSAYIETSNQVSNFGSSDFTIEGWFYFETHGGNQILASQPGTVDGHGWVLFIENGTNMVKILASNSVSGGWSIGIGAGYVPPVGQWVHIAVVRNGSMLTMYMNGANIGASNIGTQSFEFTDQTFRLGKYMDSFDASIHGYIDNFRITLGQAVYTADFSNNLPGDFTV